MAWTNLFTIGTTDLTQWERKPDHNVNRTDIYQEWTDGNWINHRIIARTRVSGSVVLSFSKETDFANFMSLMVSARDQDGYYPVTVWCSNTNTIENINAFLDISGDTKWDVSVPIKHHEISVTITQR